MNDDKESKANKLKERRAKKKRRPTKPLPVLEDDEPKHDLVAFLPVELLAEILSYVTPRDVLAIARCSRRLCQTLVDPKSAFIWRYARANCQAAALCDPTPNFTEPAYAAFIFDPGVCEMCGKTVDKMYDSFSLRLRLCKTGECLTNWTSQKGFDMNEAYSVMHSRDDVVLIRSRIPTLEMRFNLGFCRASDWEEACREYDELTKSEEGRKIIVDRCAADTQRREKINAFCENLLQWAEKVQRTASTVRHANYAKARVIALREGWSHADLMDIGVFSGLFRQKTTCMELISERDFNEVRPAIQDEMIRRFEIKQRRNRDNTYRQNREDVAAYYHRMKSDKDPSIMPTLPTFRTLPLVQTLQRQSSKSATTSIDWNSEESSTLRDLLQDNLTNWKNDAEEKLATILGYPRYISFVAEKLNPVKRLTARFLCSRCMKVNKKRAETASMDFKAVCSHQCPGMSKKQKAKYVWKAENFVPDTKAIKVVKKYLAIIGMSEDESHTLEIANAEKICVLCKSCTAPVIMNFNAMIGHCKRHDDMEIDVDVLTAYQAYLGGQEIEYGLCKELQGRQKSAPRKRSMRIYGCRHCFPRVLLEMNQAEEKYSNDGEKKKKKAMKSNLMSFDGLRSHIKKCHGVEDIRDEDVFREVREVGGQNEEAES